MPETTIADLIRAEAKRQKVPAELALGVAEQESGFNPGALGPEITVDGAPTRAVGIFQLLPSTAKRLKVDPNDPQQNITGGVSYLRELLDQHKGDEAQVLATYGGVVRDTTYVPGVQKRIGRYRLLEQSRAAREANAIPGPPAPATAGGTAPFPTPLPAGAALPGAEPSMVTDSKPATFWDVEKMYLADFFSSLDPRSAEGRRNIVSLGAEGAATMAAGPRAGHLVRAGAPAAAAAVAGGAETAVENALGTGTGDNPIGAGMAQGAYSLGGYALSWIPRRLGSVMFGSRVARNAQEAIEGGVTRAGELIDRTTAQGKAAVAAAREQARESLEAARLLALSTVETIKAEGRDALAKLGTKTAATRATAAAGQKTVDTVKAAAADALAKAELQNASALSAIKGTYNSLTQAMPSAAAAAQAAREVFTGPTKVALDAAGERVAAAAAQGPRLRFAPVQAAVRAIEAKAPTTIVQRALVGDVAGEATSNVGVMASVAASGKEGGRAVARDGRKMDDLKFSEWVAEQAARVAEGGEIDTLPQILATIRDAEVRELDFSTMHALKRVLDYSVNWDRAARSVNEQMTKGTRKVVREVMSAFEPYNSATAAYESLVNIYRRGVGRKLGTAFKNNPDAAAKLLDPAKPIQAQQLRSLLVDQAAAGGDAAAGQAAWDQARSVFVHQNVLNGGIDQLEAKLTKLQHSSDFYNTLFGDPSGGAVIQNMWSIAHAYNDLVARAAESTAAVKAAGQAAKTAAVTARNEGVAEAGEAYAAAANAQKTVTKSKIARQRMEARNRETALAQRGRAAVQDAENAAAAAGARAEAGLQTAQDALAAFKKSSLAKKSDTVSEVVGDVSHVARVGAFTRGTVQALTRLLRGPKGNDLLEYMAYSGDWTQRFVRASQSPYGDRALSEFLRGLVAVGSAPDVEPVTLAPAPAAAAPTQ